jgi:uncharacterized protein (DUF3084 family)
MLDQLQLARIPALEAEIASLREQVQKVTKDRDHWKSLVEGTASHLVKVEEENSVFEEKLQQANVEVEKVRSEFQGLCVTYQQEIGELNAKLQQAQAEAGAMRAMLKKVDGCSCHCGGCSTQIDTALFGSAGREFAERLEKMEQFVQSMRIGAFCGEWGCEEEVNNALAALDGDGKPEKGAAS